jgi:hypothetical protein
MQPPRVRSSRSRLCRAAAECVGKMVPMLYSAGGAGGAMLMRPCRRSYYAAGGGGCAAAAAMHGRLGVLASATRSIDQQGYWTACMPGIAVPSTCPIVQPMGSTAVGQPVPVPGGWGVGVPPSPGCCNQYCAGSTSVLAVGMAVRWHHLRVTCTCFHTLDCSERVPKQVAIGGESGCASF